jgi:putative ABC transport system substrate-binding protein
VREGLVDSLARPGGNITGSSVGAINAKRLEVLREVIPTLTRVGLIDEPDNPANSVVAALLHELARALNITLHVEHIRTAADFKRAFEAVVKARVQAVMNSTSGLAYAHRKVFIDLARERCLATACSHALFARDGALLGLGPDPKDVYPRAATYVDRILKGAKPADLPIEQPARWEFVVNLKTAKALGHDPAIPAGARERNHLVTYRW